MTNIKFLHSLFHRNDGTVRVWIFYWIPAFKTVQETLARLRYWRKTQPPKSPLSGGLSMYLPIVRGLVTQFPPDKGGQGGLGMTNIEFLHSLFHRNDGAVRVWIFYWIPAFKTVQETLARLRYWRKTQPPKSPLSGGLSMSSPHCQGACHSIPP